MASHTAAVPSRHRGNVRRLLLHARQLRRMARDSQALVYPNARSRRRHLVCPPLLVHQVTYHGPGQLVCYPLLNLRAYRQDAHWYMRALEEVAMRTVSTLGLVPAREPGLTGVWVGGGKLCAIGVKLSRWVTMHGLALNVHPDLAHFEHIVPCGIADRPVTSVADELRRCGLATASLEEVHTILLGHFADVFDVQLKVVDQTPAALHRDAGRPIDSLARDG